MAQLGVQDITVTPAIIGPCNVPTLLGDVKHVDLSSNFEQGLWNSGRRFVGSVNLSRPDHSVARDNRSGLSKIHGRADCSAYGACPLTS
jgi:hypothetical protein